MFVCHACEAGKDQTANKTHQVRGYAQTQANKEVKIERICIISVISQAVFENVHNIENLHNGRAKVQHRKQQC